jgi:Ca2+-binding RTX toxin-like protein
MRIFRLEGVPSVGFQFPLTTSSPQQMVVILDSRDEAEIPDGVTLWLLDPTEIPEPNLEPDRWYDYGRSIGREILSLHREESSGVHTVVVSFDPEPGEVVTGFLHSGYADERSWWKLRILLDGLGTIPLVIAPATAGQTIDSEQEDGSFVTSITLDIHHIDAELEGTTRGVQTVGMAVQFDAATGYMILGPGQLLDKNMTTGETHLLARVTAPIEFPVAVNYLPDAQIEADFRRDLAGLALDITDMTLTKDGAVFGFETYMPSELGGFFLTRGAFNAPDGDMLITRTGIAGAPEFSVADTTNSRLFNRFNADLSDIDIAYDKAADRLTVTSDVTLRDFIAPGVDLPLHFSSGGGFVVEGGAGRLQGALSALGSWRLASDEGADPFRVTLEGLSLDLSDPTVINLRTGLSVDVGFGQDIHLPAVEARVGVTPDFTLDELVLELPELFDLPLAPPVFFMTAAKLGLYGLAPGGVVARAALEADISILPDLPLPHSLENVVDLGQISLAGQIGLDGFQGTGQLVLGTVLGGSLFTLDTAVVIDAATRTLTATATTGVGLPIAGTGFVNSFVFSAGLDGTATVHSSITLSIPSNIAWALSFAGLPDPASVTFAMTGNFSPQGTLADQYLEGGVDLGVLGFDVHLGARLAMDGTLQFTGYDVSDAPEFEEAPPAGAPAGTGRRGMETREGQDLAMRTTGETEGVALIGPDGRARSLAELEADETDGILVQRDAAGASLFIRDAAAGRWAIEAPEGNGFVALEEQPAVVLDAAMAGKGGSRQLVVQAQAPDAEEIRIEVYRDADGAGFDGELVALGMTAGGERVFFLSELGLPQGASHLYVRAVAAGHLAAETYLPAPVVIAPSELPDRGIQSMRWIPQEPAEEGAAPRFALEITLREYGRVTEAMQGARLVVNGEVIETFSAPGLVPRETLTFTIFAEPGEGYVAPAPGEELRATLTLLGQGKDTNPDNDVATAALFTNRDGVTAPFLMGTPEADLLRGTAAAELIQGLGGHDRLLGGGGGDTLQGGKGDDRYWLTDAADRVIERAEQGRDTIYASVSLTLAANVENLVLQGTAGLTGTGNALANAISGTSGANHLRGLAGNDSLDGGAGGDTMAGGLGNDSYAVDDVGDVVVETAGEGTDSVRTTLNVYALTDHVERLVFTGTGAFTGTGNALANVMTGGSLQDTLFGGDGADVLNGGAGVDHLVGGLGNDTYHVDEVDELVEEVTGGGHDRVIASLSWTLGAELERLSLSGTADLHGTGNALANRLDGNAGANLLDGGEGQDSLYGLAGADTLFGGAGADMLDGGTGADSMEGGADNDVYQVDHPDDIVVERAGEGYDRIVASLSRTLDAEVERLTLSGTANLNGTGNALANRLDGNGGANMLDGGDGNDVLYGLGDDDTLTGAAGADLLDGGLGADRLVGGAGADVFLFRSLLEAAGDVVVDFSPAERDRLDLRSIDANTNLAGDQAFAWIGVGLFGGVAGQLRFAEGVISGDVDGDGLADFQIELAGVVAIGTGSIWL